MEVTGYVADEGQRLNSSTNQSKGEANQSAVGTKIAKCMKGKGENMPMVFHAESTQNFQHSRRVCVLLLVV